MSYTHIPTPEPQQYTQALYALTIATACMDVLRPALEDTPTQAAMRKVDRWVAECRKSMPKTRRLSAGAKRELDAAFDRTAPYIETNHLAKLARAEAWAANLHCAELLVHDARITCPIYAHGSNWRYLDQTLGTLCKIMAGHFPDAPERGTDIYMDVSFPTQRELLGLWPWGDNQREAA